MSWGKDWESEQQLTYQHWNLEMEHCKFSVKMIFNLEFHSQKNYQVKVFCFFNALTYLGKLSRGKNKIIFKHVPSKQTKKEYMGPQNRHSVTEETLVQTEAEG